jgi:hypothetical protein
MDREQDAAKFNRKGKGKGKGNGTQPPKTKPPLTTGQGDDWG